MGNKNSAPSTPPDPQTVPSAHSMPLPKPDFVGRLQDVNATLTFLRGLFIGRYMQNSLLALGYMQQRHAGQTRRDGQPYIVHPLAMASHALSINDPNVTDDLVATLLLHDVCEDTGVTVKELPFNGTIRSGVKRMSLIRFNDETKYELKKRFYNELLESKEATIGKGFDRYNNLTTMSATFPEDKIRKNVVETDLLLLPALKNGEELWPEASNLLRLLRTSVRNINDIYALAYKVRLSDPSFVNAPDAQDYTHLLTQS